MREIDYVVISQDWQTSQRRYGVLTSKDFRIPVAEGIELNSYLFRPDDGGRFPVILSVCAYDLDDQIAPVMPIGTGGLRGHMEAGDPEFFVRRGYVHCIVNVRGSGKSDGFFEMWAGQEILDLRECIEWLARQPWCDGNVGMFGVSYFAVVAKRVATLRPPSLKCIFSPYGLTDLYRDLDFQGGILRWNFRMRWIPKIPNIRVDRPRLLKQIGRDAYLARIDDAMNDPEIAAIPNALSYLKKWDEGANAYIIEPWLNPLCDDFYDRLSDYDWSQTMIPAYLGGDWGVFGLHLGGDVRSWAAWQGPKKFTIGPPVYLDRPLYQYQYESLRWFDHWLKGIDSGLLEERRVRLFLDNSGDWVEANDYPVPSTRWTPFYLHEKSLLSEHEFWPNEAFSAYVDSPYERGGIAFTTPPMVETTDLCGPFALKLFASTTDSDVLWFVSLYEVTPEGKERLLTRGWLRGSQRGLDVATSKPWAPRHRHDRREPLVPGEIYEFDIAVQPYGIRLLPGYRLSVRIRSCDDEPIGHHLQTIGAGRIARQASSRITVYHDADHPSHLLIPIIRGNVLGTFISGGKLTT